MYEDSLAVLMLKIEKFCEDRKLAVDDIKQSVMSSIVHGIYKGVEDAVITREEEEYFFAFLDRCGIAFSEVPASLRKIFQKGIEARDCCC